MSFRWVMLVLILTLFCWSAWAADAPKAAAPGTNNVDMHMVAKIRVGSSTRAQVTELLGTPWRMVNYGDCNPIDDQEMWEYLGQDADGKFRINLEFDEAGVVRIISKTPAKGPVLVLAAAAKRANPTHQH